MSSSNLAVLTNSHRIIASKKRAKRNEVKEVVFDETARREFLTGFHKRKVLKQDAARKKAQDREKQERLDTRREKRQLLAEKAAQNAADVEKAYGGTVPGEGSDDEWGGVGTHDEEREEEYEDEEQLATVTVVEDFDPDELLHGPNTAHVHEDADGEGEHDGPSSVKPVKAAKVPPTQRKKTHAKVAKKAKEIKYETNAARRQERGKQHKRKLEKADRAGGKGSRRKGAGRGKR